MSNKKNVVVKDLYYEGITQSFLRAFLSCRQQAFYRVCGIRSAMSHSHFDFGNVVHHLLEQWKGSGYSIRSVNFCEEEVEAFCKEQAKYFRERTEKYLVVAAIAVVVQYIMYWKRDNSSYLVCDSEAELDKCLEFITRDKERIQIRLRGKLDGVLKRKNTKGSWIYELKTTGTIPRSGIETLEMDFQTLYYAYLLKQQGGEDIAGVLYEYIRRPSFSTKKHTPLSYYEYCISKIKENPESFFQRFEIKFSEKLIESYPENIRRILDDLIYWKEHIHECTNRNYAACKTKYTCPYIALCLATPNKIGQTNLTKAELAGYKIADRLNEELEDVEPKE